MGAPPDGVLRCRRAASSKHYGEEASHVRSHVRLAWFAAELNDSISLEAAPIHHFLFPAAPFEQTPAGYLEETAFSITSRPTLWDAAYLFV